MDPIEQLVNVYLSDEEWWHENKLDREEAYKYHERMVEKGNLVYFLDGDEVVGYFEAWRINYEQWGRLVCKENVSGYLENTQDGNIAYLANVWIKKEYRNGRMIKKMQIEFFKQNNKCDYYVGQAMRKSADMIKVFKKGDLQSSMFTGK